MKLKTSRPCGRNLGRAALVAAMGLSGLVDAQTVGTTYTYITSPGSAQTTALGGAGDFNRTLVASGYASESYGYAQGNTAADDNINPNATTSGHQNGGGAGVGNGNNVTATGIDMGTFTLQGGPGLDGSYEVITSITLLLYVTGASVTAPDPIVSLYPGLNNYSNTGAVGSTYTVGNAEVGSYIEIDIPASIAFEGFTIADFVRRNPQDLVNYGTENNTTSAFQPAYRVNTVYVIPEPSTALLGAIGSLALLRRRRA